MTFFNPFSKSCIPKVVRKFKKKQQLESDTNNGLVQNWEGVQQGCILSACLFNLKQSTSCEMPDWMKHRLESRLPREISVTADDTTLMAESEEELKSLLMKVKESEKAGLKLNKKWRSCHLVSSLYGNRWGNNGNSDRLYFLGLPNHCRWWLQPWN